MKSIMVTGSRIIALLGLAALAVSAGRAVGPAFEIYPLDNGVGRGSWTPERQASTLAEIGFDGISNNYTNLSDLRTWLAELKQRRLKLYGLYFGAKALDESPFPAGIGEAIAMLRGTDAVLWLTLPKPPRPGDNPLPAQPPEDPVS